MGPPFVTVGNDVLELCVGQTATVPEFLGHPRSNTLISAISFLKTRNIQEGPNQSNKEDWGPRSQPCFSCQKLLL